MEKNKSIPIEEMDAVTGGTSQQYQSVTGLSNYATEQKTCPVCGSTRLMYKTFAFEDGKTGKIGQCCENGHSWTFGSDKCIL